MKMGIKPRFLLVAAAVAAAFYFAGVPVGTLLLIAAAGCMMSMHLGGHGGHGGGGHGGGGHGGGGHGGGGQSDVGPADPSRSSNRAGPVGVPPRRSTARTDQSLGRSAPQGISRQARAQNYLG